MSQRRSDQKQTLMPENMQKMKRNNIDFIVRFFFGKKSISLTLRSAVSYFIFRNNSTKYDLTICPGSIEYSFLLLKKLIIKLISYKDGKLNIFMILYEEEVFRKIYNLGITSNGVIKDKCFHEFK